MTANRVFSTSPRKSLSVAAGLALVIALGTSLSRPDTALVQHTSVSSIGGDVESPGAVSGVSWTWQPGDGIRVVSIAPFESGVLVVLNDGVVALDSGSGEEHWRYRTPGEDASVRIDQNDGNVLVHQELTESATNRIVTLSGADGTITDLAEYPAVEGSEVGDRFHDPSVNLVAAAGRFLSSGESARTDLLTAHSTRTGEASWGLRSPDECLSEDDDGSAVRSWAVAEDQLVVPFQCADDAIEGDAWDSRDLLNRVEVNGYSLSEGEISWTHTVENRPRVILPDVSVSDDGTRILLQEIDNVDRSLDRYVILDSTTGSEVASGLLNGSVVREAVRGDPGGGFLTHSEADGSYAWLSGEGDILAEAGPSEARDDLDHVAVRATPYGLFTVGWTWGEASSVDLQVQPWDGSDHHTVEDVLGRAVFEDEHARIVPVSGGLVVHNDTPAGITRIVGVR